jgi:YfiH family protein
MISNTSVINRKDSLVYITFPRLTEAGLVKHAFTTRMGGVSEGIFSSMNMSFSRGDKKENVLENYKILCGALDIDFEGLVLSHQTHTNNVICVNESHKGTGITKPSFENVDGLITDSEGVALVTQYADCTPLLFFDRKNRVIATSHSGWRGTVKQIARVTVNKMISEYGSNPENIIAAIGPVICKDCYEVDTPVYEEFRKLDLNHDKIFTRVDGEHFLLDLREANRQILVNSGIKNENIDICDICTACNSEEMYSHRASGDKRGNLCAVISL